MKKIFILIIIIIPLNVKAITASSYIVMDSKNNRVLEGNNINKISLIASTTKIMTAIVTINNVDLSKKIEVGNEVLKSFGSGIYVKPGEILSYKNLLYGLMLRSGNDAAITIATNVGGSEEGFVELMNETAKNINMKNTNFINSNGLEYEDNYNTSTVYDMALLSSYAIKNNIYKEIVGTKKITVQSNDKTYQWYNKNKLLQEYKYCIGGKTGYTKKAKRTLVTNAQKNKILLTIVTFNDSNDFKDHQELYEKYFKKLKNYKIIKKGKIKTEYNNTYINKSYSMALTKDEYNNIVKKVNYNKKNNSSSIGTLEVSLNGQKYFETSIYQKQRKVKNQSIIEKIKRKLGLYD